MWRIHTHPLKGAIFDLFKKSTIQKGVEWGDLGGGFG